MYGAASFCAVILAAGESSRMGTDKALLPWPPVAPGSAPTGQTFLSSAIESLNDFSDAVLVVAGKNAANIAPVVYANGASMIRNPAPERGQFSSLQVGLQEVLNRGRDAAIVTLVDRPPVKRQTLQVLCNAFSSAPHETWALVPQYADRHGHPYLIGRQMIEAFLRASPTSNAREVEHQHQQHIQYLTVEDPTVTLNVDTPEDYGTLFASSPQK
jgi:molybdenum cofactor cytidylyltransferase